MTKLILIIIILDDLWRMSNDVDNHHDSNMAVQVTVRGAEMA